MRHRNPVDRRCTYLVVIDHDSGASGDLGDFASYLSSLSLADCEVIVVDASSAPVFEKNRRILRWVAQHVAVRPRYRNFGGNIDPVRTATDLASCEKIIVAGEQVRYDARTLDEICSLLELHEVVEPQDYLDPLPWWGGIDAGRMLLHRGVEPLPDHGATFGFRKNAVRGLRGVADVWSIDDPVRKLSSRGAEVFSAVEVFVRRVPPMLRDWLRERPLQASDDFALPLKTAFFFALIPMLLLLATFGGVGVAGGYAGAIAFGSMALAVRGRSGAASFFPLRTCLYAPLWIFERSFSVYWALLRKLRGTTAEPGRIAVADGGSGERVASGE